MNLFGWDLVYAASVEVVNKKFTQLAKFKDQSFQCNLAPPYADEQVHVSGVFGAWSISANPSTKLIWLKLPLSNLNMESPSTVLNVAASTVTLTVELNLGFVSATGSSNLSQLGFAFADSKGPSSMGDSIKVVEFDDPGSKFNAFRGGVFKLAIITYLKEHASELNYVFASAFLHNGQADWLSPDNISFGIAKREDHKAYLCLFGGMGSNQGQPGQVDSLMFNSSDDIYLGFSSGLFMQRVVLPGFHQRLNGYQIFNNNGVLQGGSFKLPDVVVGLITYHPQVDSLQVSIAGTQLATTIQGSCDMYLGIRLSFTYSSFSPIALDKESRSIKLLAPTNEAFNHQVNMGDKGGPEAPMVSLIVKPIITVITNAIGDSIANVISKTGPGAGLRFVPVQLQWSNVDFSRVNQAIIADNFFITGLSN